MLRGNKATWKLYIVIVIAILSSILDVDRGAAGINTDGVLILHADTLLVYSAGSEGYCGFTNLEACSLAVDTVPADPGVFTVFFAIASFPDSVDNRLSGVVFGIDYDPMEFFIVDSGHCGDFELGTANWPEPQEGTAVTWGAPRSGRDIEVYWFAGYSGYGNATAVSLVPHPTQGGEWADGQTPAAADPIVGYGVLGFGMAGSNECPSLPPEGGGSWGTIIGQ